MAFLSSQQIIKRSFKSHGIMARTVRGLIANGALGYFPYWMFSHGTLLNNYPTFVGAFLKKWQVLYGYIIRIAQIFHNQQISVFIGTRLSQHILVIGAGLAEHFAQALTQGPKVILKILFCNGNGIKSNVVLWN